MVKQGIKKYLFYPYLIFLIAFLYYTVEVFENYQKAYKVHSRDYHEPVPTDSTTNATLILSTAPEDYYSLNMTASEMEITVEELLQKQYYLSREIFIVKTIVTLCTLYFFSLEVRQMFL